MARRGYHHGNLREALGFTLAETALSAGVRRGTYGHFRDRNELVADVAP